MPIIRDTDSALYTFAVGTLPDDELRVLRFRGSEGISQLFCYDLALVSRAPDLDFDAVLGEPAVLTIWGPDKPRYVHGIVSSFEQGPVSDGFTRYYARLVPRQWLLTESVDCRIYQHMNVPAIVEAVLKEAGLPASSYRMVLEGSYPVREYCVQYAESCWNFVSRLLEDEGIFYYFEHDTEDHVLVVADTPNAHRPIAGDENVPLRASSNLDPGVEYVEEFRYGQSVRKGAVHLRDFDFKKPRASLDAQSSANERRELALFEYPAGHQDTAVGRRRARARLEEERMLRAAARGVGVVTRMVPGFRFSLVGHERADFDREYLITELRQEGHEPQALEEEMGDAGERSEYANEFRCVPADVPYRSERRTPRPVIRGTQTATVVGPDGEEIYTNEYGQIKVRFHWDARAEANEHSSGWLRLTQATAGAGFGTLALLRVGQEVVVAFHEGDPDRPHVLGATHNEDNPTPYELPTHKTISTIKTASSKGCRGSNELRFQDLAGEEQIFLHAERDLDVRVRNDAFEWIGNERQQIVKGSQLEAVHVDRHESVGRDHIEKVKRDRHLRVGGKEAKSVGGDLSLTVYGDASRVYRQNLSEEVMGKQTIRNTALVVESLAAITLKCGPSSIVLDPIGITLSAPMLVLDGTMVNIASGPGAQPHEGDPAQPVAPTQPSAPEEADEAQHGRTTDPTGHERKKHKGRHDRRRIVPFIPNDDEDDPTKTFVAIELVDEHDQPVPGERYEIELPDGRIASGTLDGHGRARVAGIDPGDCVITFPDLDRAVWEPA